MTKRPGSRTTGVVPENKKVAEWKNSTQSPVDNDSDGHNSDENEWFCNQTTIEAIEKHREGTYAGGWFSTELGIDLPKKDEKRKKSTCWLLQQETVAWAASAERRFPFKAFARAKRNHFRLEQRQLLPRFRRLRHSLWMS